jgi:protein-tyrosine phosphatase
VFQELLKNAGPLSVNCTAGQDRTGVAVALILSALGVPREFILTDYHLSTEYRRPHYEVPPLEAATYANNPAAALLGDVSNSTPLPLYSEAGRSMLAELLDYVVAQWGSVDNYLSSVLGIGPAQRASLRSLYLE